MKRPQPLDVLTFLLMATALTFLLAGLFGCSKQSPMAPTDVTKQMDSVPPKPTGGPLHHNIPATDNDESETVWLCATQPRLYALPGGGAQWTEDHYISGEPCPAVPID